MAEYIERKKAMDVCKMHYQHCLEMHDWSGDATAENIKTDIETLPAADVVEVVRCKDCKFWGGKYSPNECSRITELADPYYWLKTLPDDFCSSGKRKDGAE